MFGRAKPFDDVKQWASALVHSSNSLPRACADRPKGAWGEETTANVRNSICANAARQKKQQKPAPNVPYIAPSSRTRRCGATKRSTLSHLCRQLFYLSVAGESDFEDGGGQMHAVVGSARLFQPVCHGIAAEATSCSPSNNSKFRRLNAPHWFSPLIPSFLCAKRCLSRSSFPFPRSSRRELRLRSLIPMPRGGPYLILNKGVN